MEKHLIRTILTSLASIGKVEYRIKTPTVVKDSILAIGVTKVYHHGFDN